MWKLVPAAGTGEPYRLLSGTEYVVGRKNCAILIQHDMSISRSHAVLTVSRPGTTSSQSLSVPVLTVTDTSKYGTFINGSKLGGTSESLQSGDRINFGVLESKFRVEYEPLVVCSSCLDVAQKTALNQAIQQLGGLVVNEWTKDCTHLVMVSVKVTVKTICALICGRPIIKPEFFVELIKAIQSRQQLPNHKSFYPPVDEPSIGTEKVDLSEHPERKKIFSGKTFVFLTAKQHKKLGPAVILGGGEAKLMTEGRKETSLLVSPDVCVVDVMLTNSQIPGSDSMRSWTDSVLTLLQSKNLRAIPEAEIGLAVLFMSTEKFCNPQKQLGNKVVTESTRASAVVGQAVSQSLVVDETITVAAADDSTAYVADTEIEEQTWGRAEEGEETSVAKLAKLEEESSPVPKFTEPAASSVRNSEAGRHQKENNILDLSPNFALEDTGIKLVSKNAKLTSDKTNTKTTSSEKHASKRRKELDDLSEDAEALEIVFGSRDLDWEGQMADHDQEAQRKKKCLEAKGSRIREVNVKQREENKILEEEVLGSVLTPEAKSEFKEQSPVLVAYPGVGQLPYIIGKSDLIAHQAKRNSELEEWLRQEMEEQNRHAREESLADDLFRYDPNVKRRR
ncbi:Nibrin [Amazona aestiva]|uniref:Nibrin n=1 Tax=Amazona aestiva TaxID=12930 RepID=A0A0Q3QR21_AMAAE|nr:Nibrin [Amazona aestiva]